MSWRVNLTPTADQVRQRLAVAIEAKGVTEADLEWLTDAAARNATIHEGTITLPSPIGARDITGDGVALWLEHYAWKYRPSQNPDPTDADVGNLVNLATRGLR